MEKIENFNREDITKLLLDAYIKVLKVNITTDTFVEVKLEDVEANKEFGYSESISTWLYNFANTGNVYSEDKAKYLSFTNIDNINKQLDNGKSSISLTYRRKTNGIFKWVKMSLVKSYDYKDDNRVLILYIQDIDDDVINTNTIAKQQLDIDEKDRITDSLMYMYFTCLYVDMSDNTYQKVYVDPQLEKYIAHDGDMHDVVDNFFNNLVIPKDKNLFNRKFSINNIRDMLNIQNSFEYDYWAEYNGKSICCRISAILVDKFKDGKIHHVMITMQDITTTQKFKEETNSLIKDVFASSTAASNAKNDFLSRMSHDMRTPLNGIIGMTAIAGAHINEQERVEDCLVKINSASKHLLSLINDILDLSKMESGKLTLNEEEFNLSTLLKETLDMFTKSIIENQIDLNFSVNSIEHENVIGDARHLKEVFTNLISNAIKYSDKKAKISLTLKELPIKSNSVGLYEFVCEDNGIGMSEEFVKKIFLPFERADDVYTSKVEGTGLGMSIVKNILNMMGGDIVVDSKLNQGSKFTVTFKLKLQENLKIDYKDLYDLCVLVVDDDLVTCESTCISLDQLGMKSSYALSGEEALEKVIQAHSDKDDYFACLIDWKMPGMDGFETTRRIRKIVGPDVTIVIISAYEWDEIETEAIKAGADGFIAKPLFKSRLELTFKEARAGKKLIATSELGDFKKVDFSSKTVLLVEDNDLNREIASEIISSSGCKVEVAVDGDQAVSMFKDSAINHYDMIFMDISMPIKNGYQASSEIRDIDRSDSKQVPIIALTANAFVDDVIKAKQCGMNEHLSKPIEFARLLEIMNKYLN